MEPIWICRFVLASLAMGAATGYTVAQCEPAWVVPPMSASLGIPDTDGVFALHVWNGDLVAGGTFQVASGQPASRVARWDGTSWHPLGTGANGDVLTLGEFGGDLIAGGLFSSAGGTAGPYLARWNGKKWVSLGSGVNKGVFVVREYNDELIVGGRFTIAGGVPVGYIAAWDGAQWRALGAGFSSSPGFPTPLITSLIEFDGGLVAAGRFTKAGSATGYGVARWDGTSWSTFPPSTLFFFVPDAAAVHDLAVFRGDLYAGGSFFGGPEYLARWNGSAWSAVGGGVSNPTAFPFVESLEVFGEYLYVGGSFTMAGGQPSQGIARWDGSEWHPIGLTHNVLDSVIYQGKLAVGGAIVQAGGQPAGNWALIECESCYPDCDGDSLLTLADFGCFQTKFGLGDMYADCDGDAILTLADFGCFQTKFGLGCP